MLHRFVTLCRGFVRVRAIGWHYSPQNEAQFRHSRSCRGADLLLAVAPARHKPSPPPPGPRQTRRNCGLFRRPRRVPAARCRSACRSILQAGWKTYWRSPGDAGFPVTLNWAGSTNLASAQISPGPYRIASRSSGWIPLAMRMKSSCLSRRRLPTNRKPLGLRLKVDYLVCEKVCIPYSANLVARSAGGCRRTDAISPSSSTAMPAASRATDRPMDCI